jgi:2-keto-3-deoxy-L-rhamnonate aldolase RhmA
MKVAALQKLRKKLAADEAVYGLWVTLESASITEMAVALGLDWIVIDAEHGHLDWKEILEHVRAAVRSDTVVLVRIAELNAGAIKRALDIGADGVVIPWIETAEQLRQAVAFAMYPPEGIRGIGAERATAWGQCFVECTQEANENVLVVPIVESVKGGRNIQALLQVGGLEIVFIGPADYSSSAGFRGQWEGPGVAKELLAIKDAVRASGKYCGVVATSHENLVERRVQGFRMLGFGTDCGMFLRGLRAALGVVGQDRQMSLSLSPDNGTLPMTPVKPSANSDSTGPKIRGRRRASKRER